MLDFDYPKHYAALIQTVAWNIDLPEEWNTFFSETGIAQSSFGEQRGNQRRIVRILGLMCIEQRLPAIEQNADLFGVYTKDFSKDSCGVVTPFQLYPETLVRLILPTFWLKLRVVRARRITKTCYDIGTALLERHDPDRKAFILSGNFLDV